MGQYKVKKNKWWILFIIIPLIILVMFLVFNRNTNFNFKTIKSSCSDFNVTGSIAYNKSKSSIYISDISKCDDTYKKVYKSFKCKLILKNNGKNEILSSYISRKELTLNGYLKELKLNIDDFKTNCKNYDDNNLRLEIVLLDKNNHKERYVIPLKLEKNC